MTVPTIHLNGTGANFLQSELANAYGAVNAAIEAVQQTAPNARDYYPQGPAAFPAAVAEHTARLAKLTSVRDELNALYDAIDEAVESRPKTVWENGR